MRVVVFAAHPDDEVLGVGGTILRHRDAGHDVRVAICYPCRVEDSAITEAAKRLGVPYDWYVDDMESYVLEHRPSIVYTHSLADLHADHRELHERVLVACRPSSGVQNVYAYETPSATEWGMVAFRPSRYVDIYDQIKAKNEALRAYESEMREPPHPRNPAGVIKVAQFRGLTAGMKYAEAFEVIRETW
jgi:LmbE family N-acetylglucosaminyl deacetylase